MSKAPTSSSKRRRQRRPNVPPYTGPISIDESAASEDMAVDELATSSARPAGQTGARSARAVPAAPSGPVDFRKEYSYVLKDLRSMAIVAAGMLALLVALNFFIP